MHTEGTFDPETEEAARDHYQSLGPTAQVVVREVARAMEFDRDEYRSRVTEDVVLTARDALFAGSLAVHVGTCEEFEAWCEGYDGEVHVAGSEHVDHVAWHAPPFAEAAAAATFQNEAKAAVGTLRRQAFGRLYRDLLHE